jgi:hypothetical protein
VDRELWKSQALLFNAKHHDEKSEIRFLARMHLPEKQLQKCTDNASRLCTPSRVSFYKQ